MAGTDSTKRAAAARLAKSGGPAIILVEPQLGENIGAVARAMLNCALLDLRIVRPRDGWPNPKAVAAASGADIVLERARLYDRVEDAIADLQHLYATSARPREMVKPVLTPRRAAAEIRAAFAAGERVGLLFGPERAGLSNDHLALADAMVLAPLNPAFASLNLAQAVLLLGYEWYQAAADAPARSLPLGRSPLASKAELLGLFAHLERELDRSGFLRNEEKRPTMVRNIRNMLDRAGLTRQEVRSWRGIVASLVEPKGQRAGRKAEASASASRKPPKSPQKPPRRAAPRN
jgi:tRNA/rRNA methyltransferase